MIKTIDSVSYQSHTPPERKTIDAENIDATGLYDIPRLLEFDFFEGSKNPTKEWLEHVLDGRAKVSASDDNKAAGSFIVSEYNKDKKNK